MYNNHNTILNQIIYAMNILKYMYSGTYCSQCSVRLSADTQQTGLAMVNKGE